MRCQSFVENLARSAALAFGCCLLVISGLLLPPRAQAQTCTDVGGYVGGSIVPLVQVKRDTEAYELLPRNPLPTGYGYNLYIDATAQVQGSCDDYDWNGSACVYDRTYLNTFSELVGYYTRPWVLPGPPNVIYEFAINPSDVQSLDTTDDTKSSGGPVVVLPSGGAPSSQGLTTGGTYTTQIKANVLETFCDPAELPLLDSGLLSFEVTHTGNAKNICPDQTAGPGRENEPDLEVSYRWDPPGRGNDVANRQGNPCSARSGDKWEREVDADGPILPFVRHYSSLTMLDQGLGTGWSSSYHGKMLTPLASHLNVVRPTGHAQVFTKQGDGSWLGDADTRYAISQDASGFVLTHRDGAKETYGTDGRLLAESDPSGNTTTLAYDANGRLISVTGPYGHLLSFAYDSTGHLQTVTPPSGSAGAITYGYTNGNLTTVTYPDHPHAALPLREHLAAAQAHRHHGRERGSLCDLRLRHPGPGHLDRARHHHERCPAGALHAGLHQLHADDGHGPARLPEALHLRGESQVPKPDLPEPPAGRAPGDPDL